MFEHAASATITLFETCLNENAKPIPTLSDEQLFVYCFGALAEAKINYSQKAKNFTQVCKPESLQPWGNAVVRFHSHRKGSERLLEQLVAKYGAVITLMQHLDPDRLEDEYRKGYIIAECSDQQDTPFYYPVVIIGYDTHNWIARTAFGPTFGDNGNFLLKKGAKSCETGLAIDVAECTRDTETGEEADQSNPAEDENTEDEDAEEQNAEDENAEMLRNRC